MGKCPKCNKYLLQIDEVFMKASNVGVCHKCHDTFYAATTTHPHLYNTYMKLYNEDLFELCSKLIIEWEQHVKEATL